MEPSDLYVFVSGTGLAALTALAFELSMWVSLFSVPWLASD
jgi:hypothetical protein